MVLLVIVVLVATLDQVQLEKGQNALLQVPHKQRLVLANGEFLELSFVELCGEGVLQDAGEVFVRRVVELVVSNVDVLRVERVRFEVQELEVGSIRLGLQDKPALEGDSR
uniref:Vitellogenin 2 n=1 Tax=Rhipicephalus appendiculatus TaxID=34631 RepID=A0A131YA80_RHIAP